MNELLSWVFVLVISAATVEIYVRWRIRSTAQKLREIHRREDCGQCILMAQHAVKKAEKIARLTDLDD